LKLIERLPEHVAIVIGTARGAGAGCWRLACAWRARRPVRRICVDAARAEALARKKLGDQAQPVPEILSRTDGWAARLDAAAGRARGGAVDAAGANRIVCVSGAGDSRELPAELQAPCATRRY
jgi:hypothetical protein